MFSLLSPRTAPGAAPSPAPSPSPCRARRLALARGASLLSLSAGALLGLAACQERGPRFHGVNLSGAPYGQDFSLRNPQGREMRLADFRGQVVLLFFGFTQCPDICPTALSRAVAVRQLLGPQAERLQVLFMTIDPERDSPALLQAYTQAFDPSFMGLYSDAAGTARTAKDFKVFYSKVPTGSSYTMDHSTLSYLFDPQGRLRVALKHEASAADVADDVRALLAD